MAKGVAAGTALRTLRARRGEATLPRVVDRDARQRCWARQGTPTYQDTLAEVRPNTREWVVGRVVDGARSSHATTTVFTTKHEGVINE